MATINGKKILLNESILFAEGQTVEFGGAFPLRITADASSAGGLDMQGIGDRFHLTVDGFSATAFSRVLAGKGNWQGAPVTYYVHAQLVATVGEENVYDVKVTAFHS